MRPFDVDRKHDVATFAQIDLLLVDKTQQLLEVVLSASHFSHKGEEEGIEREGVLLDELLLAGLRGLIIFRLISFGPMLELLFVDQRDVSIDNLVIEPSILTQAKEAFLLHYVVFGLDHAGLAAHVHVGAVGEDGHHLAELRFQDELIGLTEYEEI